MNGNAIGTNHTAARAYDVTGPAVRLTANATHPDQKIPSSGVTCFSHLRFVNQTFASEFTPDEPFILDILNTSQCSMTQPIMYTS